MLPGVYSFAVKPVEASSSIPSLSFTSLSQIELQHQYLPNDIVLSPIAQSIAASVHVILFNLFQDRCLLKILC